MQQAAGSPNKNVTEFLPDAGLNAAEDILGGRRLFLLDDGAWRAFQIIDCPPNLYLMTQNALLASDYYIVTAIPDHLSTIGLTTLKGKVDRMNETMTNAANLAGLKKKGYAEFAAVLFVRVRIGGQVLTTAHADKMEEVRSMVKCFDSHTTELIGYTEAAANSLPVWLHDSDNARRARDKQEYPKVVEQLLEEF